MASASTLDTLIDLATDERDAAAVALGKLQQAHSSSQAKLEALHEYRADYLQQFEQAKASGLSISSLSNYQRFLGSLERAILQQEKALSASQNRVDNGTSDWRSRQQRLNSFDVLAKRRREAAARTEARREQRQTDEFAARASARANQN